MTDILTPDEREQIARAAYEGQIASFPTRSPHDGWEKLGPMGKQAWFVIADAVIPHMRRLCTPPASAGGKVQDDGPSEEYLHDQVCDILADDRAKNLLYVTNEVVDFLHPYIKATERQASDARADEAILDEWLAKNDPFYRVGADGRTAMLPLVKTVREKYQQPPATPAPPEDAEVAEIEKRHATAEADTQQTITHWPRYDSDDAPWQDTWSHRHGKNAHKDRATLLSKLRERAVPVVPTREQIVHVMTDFAQNSDVCYGGIADDIADGIRALIQGRA